MGPARKSRKRSKVGCATKGGTCKMVGRADAAVRRARIKRCRPRICLRPRSAVRHKCRGVQIELRRLAHIPLRGFGVVQDAAEAGWPFPSPFRLGRRGLLTPSSPPVSEDPGRSARGPCGLPIFFLISTYESFSLSLWTINSTHLASGALYEDSRGCRLGACAGRRRKEAPPLRAAPLERVAKNPGR